MENWIERVLAHVQQPTYRGRKLRVLAGELNVAADEYKTFRSAVKDLIRSGQLEAGRDRAIRLPAAKNADRLLGSFKRSSRGFGFVRPQGAADRSTDIYISEIHTGDASTGDLVEIEYLRAGRLRSGDAHTGREAKIVRVISRASESFVGTYREFGGAGYVTVDGTKFDGPVLVGDPGAKGAKPGDKVTMEMMRFPSPERRGQGVITEVLGPRGQPGIDTLSIIRAYGLPDAFREETLQDARAQAQNFQEDNLSDREDLRTTLTLTIDPVHARDFDDAISLSRDDRGFWNLIVHVADVAQFVVPGAPMDVEARLRGTSVYLPDRVLPMLPEILSNGLASLQEGVVRHTLSVFMQFTPEGVRTDSKFHRAVILVDKRFTYEQAFEIMSHPDGPFPDVREDVRAMLLQMKELAMILRARRKRKGSLELVMPEIEVDLNDEGKVAGAHLSSQDVSHQVIEEFMLAANEAVAHFLNSREVEFLRRAHPAPDDFKLEQFAEFVTSLGYPLEDPQSRFALQHILEETADKPERHAVHRGLLRSLKQAVYTPERIPHYALASDDYCHFTSPIRRYPDLQVHRQLIAVIDGLRPQQHGAALETLAEHCNKTERRAEAAERELVRVKLLAHLLTRLDESFHALIIGVEDFGVFCQLVELPIEGLIHISALPSDRYDFDSRTYVIVGRSWGRRYRLGDQIIVRIAKIDIDRRTLDLIVDPAFDEAQLKEQPDNSKSPRAGTGPERRPAPRPEFGRNKSKGKAKGPGKGQGKGKKRKGSR